MDFNSVEHKISSDTTINLEMWVMNTFWTKKCQEFAAREIDRWQKKKKEHALALCYSLFVVWVGFSVVGKNHRIFFRFLYNLLEKK